MMRRVPGCIALYLFALLAPTRAEEDASGRQQPVPATPPPVPACNPVIIDGKKIATVWAEEEGYCVVAEAVGIVPAKVPSIKVGDDPLSIGIGGMVRLETAAGLDAWGLLGSLFPTELSANSYTLQVKTAVHKLASFDFMGAFKVVNVTITASHPDAPFQVEVLQGPKKGRDVCFNHRGLDSNGIRPWANLPLPHKLTYAMADTVAAMWENGDSETKGLIGRKMHESLRQNISWTKCTFTVTRYSPVILKVTGAQVTVATESVLDQMRLVYQAAAMALLLNAEMISESMVVWCTSGAAVGSLVLTILIVVMLFRKVDNNRRGVPILIVLGGGVWQLFHSFWHQYWQYVVGLYVLTAMFGCYYCYRHPLGETRMAMFSFSLQVLALGISYWAVADSGAGLIFMLSQLVHISLHRFTAATCTCDMRLAHTIAVFFGCPADLIRAVHSAALSPLHRKWNYSFDTVQAWHCVRRAAREPRYDDPAQTVCSQQLPRRCQSPHTGAQSTSYPHSAPRLALCCITAPVQNRV